MDVTTAVTDALPLTTSPDATPARAGLSSAERDKVKQFAHDFEALLLTQMLKEMRRSMVTDEDGEKGLGLGTMTDTIDSQLGAALSKSSGLGLAESLMRALDRQPGVPASAVATPPESASVPGTGALSAEQGRLAVPLLPPAAPAAISAVLSGSAPTSAPSPVDIAPPGGPVTSAFGWRSDPISGQARFHSGTDFRLAYGQDVRAAAGGRVVFAGEQSGYGETVVIDHGDGLETRYAHLSGYAVRSGDLVDAGQVVARSGNSGRTTGPHLHFEVLKGGHAVNPALMAQALGAKALPTVADSTANSSTQ